MRKKTVKRVYNKKIKPVPAEIAGLHNYAEPIFIATFSARLEKATAKYETAINNLIAKL